MRIPFLASPSIPGSARLSGLYPGLFAARVHGRAGCAALLSPLHSASHSSLPFVFQDLLMVTYLANLTQSQIALNEKLVNL